MYCIRHMALNMVQVPSDLHAILQQRIVDDPMNLGLHARGNGWRVHESFAHFGRGLQHLQEHAGMMQLLLALRSKAISIPCKKRPFINLSPLLHGTFMAKGEGLTCGEAQHMPAKLFLQTSNAWTEKHGLIVWMCDDQQRFLTPVDLSHYYSPMSKPEARMCVSANVTSCTVSSVQQKRVHVKDSPHLWVMYKWSTKWIE